MRLLTLVAPLVCSLSVPPRAGAQRADPVILYTLRIDSTDLSSWSVQMRIRGAPDSFALAMARHPEYDDRYWRYVERLTVAGARPGASIAPADSALWTVRAPGGEATVSYRIRLPPAPAGQRGSWRPFLTPTGGLTGGPHAFMYLLGATRAPSHVELDLPRGWSIATALRPTGDPRVFYAADVETLVDSPILVGALRDWRFVVEGVPHRVAYWPLPDARPFDTIAFVGALRSLSREAIALFGRTPYAEFLFLFPDGAFGGLEHAASVTLGAPSADLAAAPLGFVEEAAHEFLHSWNLMRIRPREWRGVSHRAPTPPAGLWFSEGFTMYYADALARRAGLPTEHPTREAHLAHLIEGYLDNPGEMRFSAEAVSRVAFNAGPAALGDYDASTHLQGELIGAMLDFVVRAATNGARSLDDVMRLMLERSAADSGFEGRDVERAVEDVCGCEVTPFFDAHVRAGSAIDFGRYLALAGLRLVVSREPARREGALAPDLRVAGWREEGEPALRLRVFHPEGAWARAGLHNGDRIVSMNGAPVATWPEMRSLLGRLRIGDTVGVVVSRPTGPFATTVTLVGYDRSVARIEPATGATPTQVVIRDRWSRGW